MRLYLDRIAIAVEAQIVNNHSPDRDGPAATELIYSEVIGSTPEPVVVFDQEESDGAESEEGESERYTYAVWKASIFLARPRMRLQSPSVRISAAASLRPEDPKVAADARSGYLQSRVPLGMNLLESFGRDPDLGGVKPQLSALRVSRVAPITESVNLPRPIKGLKSLGLKIFPAVHTRVRFARPNASPPSPAVIALLEIDFSPYIECEATLDKISLSATDGIVEDLNTQDGMRLPLRCVAHDHITFLYRLAPEELETLTSKNSVRNLDITIDVTALVKPDGPGPCKPRLSMGWTTTLDFSLPVNPGFGQPMTQPIQRSHRPSQLSIGGGNDAQSLISPSVSRPDALPSLEASTARSIEVPVPNFGITMTFTGPDHPVHAGDEFTWSVFVVNRTKPDAGSGPNAPTAAPARKLALVAIPRRRRNDPRVLRPPSTAGPMPKHDPLIADAVLDENVVHAMQKSSLVDGTDVVCMSADVRVGPLAPNACAVVELRFLALREGILGVEAVRVIDLGSQEHVDVRELPIVVVQGREKDEE